MISSKAATKKVILLSPHHLLSDQPFAESLHINKSKNGIDYTNHPLNLNSLAKDYPDLPHQAKDAITGFGADKLQLLKQEIKKGFTLQRAGLSFEKYYKKSFSRRMHQLMEQLKPFAELVKWYHKLPSGKGHYTTAPCRFSSYKPQLQFFISRHADQLQLNTEIVLNGSEYPLAEFTRYHFLLHSNNEYFLLSYKDYQTLEWLQENNPQQYSTQPQELAQHILAPLEADYKVNRNNLFTKNEIRETPVNRVMLSEISQQFLVLTPQWIYEGFIVDGNWQPAYETTRQGEPYVIYRNKEAETAFWKLLESLHPNFSRQLNGYYYLSFADAQKKQWFLKVYHKLLDMDIQVVGMDMLKHFRYSPHKVTAVTKIKKEEDNALILRMVVTFGDETIPLTELQKTIKAGQRAMLLKDGSLGILNEEWLQQYGAIIRHGKINNQEIQVPRWLAFSEQDATEETQVLKPVLNAHWWQKWQHWQQNAAPIYPLPSTVQATLRPYQQKGFEWMMLLSEAGAGACLADDMGLGKTLQTICFLAQQVQQQPEKRQLIICPSSLIYNWQQELEKFAPQLETFVYHGAGRDIQQVQSGDIHVIISSYGTVRSDIEQLCEIPFGIVVLDESHAIKNPAALVTMAVNRLQSGFSVCLSGTPVMNNTFDLYAQFNFLMPGIFGNREFFKREYADAIDRDKDEYKIQQLQKITAPFVLRRTKEQVAQDLPPKTETIMWCQMSEAQQMQYDAIKEQIRSSLFLNIKNEGLGKSKLAVIQGMLKLRQVCNSPLLLPEEERTCADSVKTDLLLEELTSNLADQKTLVFSLFSTMLDLLADALHKKGIAFYHFDGKTPPAKRMEMVNNFQEPGNTTNVFLISLKAGNTGLNLTAAGYVFLFDPWWNTAVQQQAIDRTHRIGQTKNIFAYKMICRNTIEEKIISLQQKKKQLAESLITEEEGFVKSLSEEDIQYLFS